MCVRGFFVGGKEKLIMDRNVQIITDLDGKKLVIINDIIFKGKQHIKWDDVENYLKNYIGDFFEIAETSDIVYIGKDLPDEYSSSKYTRGLRGVLAKTKANASQGIPELIKVAHSGRYKRNLSLKHIKEADMGWYRFNTRFALPVCNNLGELIRYNIFAAELIIRRDKNGKMYLYDIINIKKKKQSNPLE